MCLCCCWRFFFTVLFTNFCAVPCLIGKRLSMIQKERKTILEVSSPRATDEITERYRSEAIELNKVSSASLSSKQIRGNTFRSSKSSSWCFVDAMRKTYSDEWVYDLNCLLKLCFFRRKTLLRSLACEAVSSSENVFFTANWIDSDRATFISSAQIQPVAIQHKITSNYVSCLT